MADHFVALDLVKANSSSAGASDQTLAGPSQSPGRAVEIAQMSEPATTTVSAALAARQPTQPGPSNQAPVTTVATSTIEPGTSTPQVTSNSEALAPTSRDSPNPSGTA